MKRVLLIMAIFMATVTGVSAKGGLTVKERLTSEQDTIVVKMANGAKLILQLQNIEQLKAFQTYSLDSLMRELNKYVDQVDQMENTTGNKDLTVTFNTAKAADGKSEEITVTVQEQDKKTGDVKKERHEIRINKSFKIDVEVEEDGDNTKVNVNVPDKAQRDSTRAAYKESHYKASKFNFDVDLGYNNFLSTNDNQVPDLKTLGSRYVSLNLHLNNQIGGRKSPFYIVSGFEFAFNNFMFDDDIVVTDVNKVTTFTELTDRNFEKSKLTYSSVNIPIMPMLKFKRENGKDGFLIGAGGFAGYRLGSHTKLKYQEEGKTEKDKTRDNFNLSDFQYGLEGVIGYGSLNMFVKYNMNDVFKDNRGPQANVISFGLRLLN
ncbi:opacity protein-like surface antigen [Pontibacter aydingkolensis]|uniref:PorT family protein n=1 Tax=Pontibacter aydingkolensis TaxID=1911536 RepID=A0ABS7CYZ5_9BACT|nr:outer membrane beta-barrel protein [Pontibacter aydingkolensis]MBW7469074.1 PorT family protein [Pontibacter aydingkolensis]